MGVLGPKIAVRFGAFRLDPRDERLWRGTEVRRLTPKVFATLELLVARAGQLVSKDELLSSIWPDVTVSEAALATCIREIRRRLEDDARQPRLIETVHRRGFRFIGEVIPDIGSSSAAELRGAEVLPAAVVAREAEVARLQAWFARAWRGERQVGFITGEAGIGKTTVVEAFLASLGNAEAPRIARGQCIEYHGAGEAYLPVLDALGRLCWESEIYRLKGEARLAGIGAAGRSSPRRPSGDGAAETGFLEALAVARRQGARSHELRAALSLARLWATRGRRPAAMNLLVEVRGWFTEGFDTADLTAARALLQELGGHAMA